MSESIPPPCDRENCTRDSKYLLDCGNRCLKHAIQDRPEVVEYLNWATS